MTSSGRLLSIWIVDPIDYAGMAYYDAGLAGGLTRAGARVVVAGTDARLLPVPADAGWSHRAVFIGTSGDAGRAARGARYLRSLARLLRAVRRARPDAVIWEYTELAPADLVAMRMLGALGVRVLFVAHEIEPWSGTRASRWLRRRIVRGAWRVLAHGEPEAEEVRATYGLAPDRVVVTGHGDFREFGNPGLTQVAARLALDLPPDVPIALFFGSLRASKGLDLLVRAWPGVRAALPEAILVVAGRSPRGTAPVPPQDGVERRAGTIPPDQATAYFAACDVVVLPYDRITTSAVMRQAYSSRRPVVATAAGELERHVVPGQTGWLVPTGDAGALAAALADALRDRDRLRRMGEAADAYGRSAFDWTEIGAITVDAIERGLRPAE